MINDTNVPGLDGFVWWTGIVEGRNDPEKLSRIQVRMFVHHTDDKKLIPSQDLLWAIPVFPSNVSNNTYGVKEGDAVFGFYIDGKDAQQPYIFGRFPDKPAKMYPASKGFSDPALDIGGRPVEVASRTMVDSEGLRYTDSGPKRYPNPLNEQTTSRLARNQNIDKTPLPFIKSNIKKGIELPAGLVWDEVSPDYEAKYPYNDSKQSESGHFIDVDDTQKKERINLMHRTGTMQEMRHTGTIHRKDLKHAVRLVHGSDLTNIRGNSYHTTERWTRIKSKGRALVDIDADARLNIAGTLNLNVGGDLVIKVQGKIYMGATGAGVPIVTPKNACAGETVLPCPTSDPIVIDSFRTVLKGVECAPHTHLYFPGEYGQAPTSGPIGTGYTSPDFAVCGGSGIAPMGMSYTNKPEAFIDNEINVSCIAATEDEAKKKSFEQWLQELLDRITGPGAGGAGAKWCFQYPGGTEKCVDTHHATSDAEILMYAWCSGATGATGHENSTGITTPYTPPEGYVCPGPGG